MVQLVYPDIIYLTIWLLWIQGI